MFFYTISLKGYKMNEKTIYRLFFSLSVIFLIIVTPYIFLISGPSFSIFLIPIVLIFILIFIIAFIKKNKKIYDFMLYVLLFILSIIIFFLVTVSALNKHGANYIVFMPIVLICTLVFIVSYIKQKKEIYYFMLYILLFYFISIIIGILLIITLSIFGKGKALFVLISLFIFEMSFFVPYIYSIIVRKYKLALQPENTLLKTDLEKSKVFMRIITILTCCFNLLLTYYIC